MSAHESQVHILGIRHHGPGSTSAMLQALEAVAPEIVLIEGPPDAAEVLPLAAHPQMQPPVALLLFAPDAPRQSVFYPFAVFSPEWQALQFAFARQLPVRFIDLPTAYRLAIEDVEEQAVASEAQMEAAPEDKQDELPADPLTLLAQLAGYSDGESWWDAMVETRRNSMELFAAVREAMAELRATPALHHDELEPQREAWMRQAIRAAQKEGYNQIAVVCGAWHAPALAEMPPAKQDAELLKGLPKRKVDATWIPWTHQRLAYQSGYGAGILSPGWYHHLWTTPEDTCTAAWVTKIARLFREKDHDASSAHIIEAVRLAESLAMMRELPQPGLREVMEATQSVLCFGDPLPLRLVHEQLIVGETMGSVPEETPLAPLAHDLQQRQKRLRLPAEAAQKTLDLDLRNETDIARSKLLHSLRLLNIPWGDAETARGAKGTFHELWRLQWQPEFAVRIIEAGQWGNTVESAAEACACAKADATRDLPALTAILDIAILADLPRAVERIMLCVNNEAALTSDLSHMMQAVPPLVRILRYGNVRQTDTSMIATVVSGMVARVCVGLPPACSAITDDAAAQLFREIDGMQGALTLLEAPEEFGPWYEALAIIGNGSGYHGLPAGRACRILLDAGVMEAADVGVLLSRALSPSADPAQAAAWLEGFLAGSGMLLMMDDRLYRMVDEWVCGLSPDIFPTLLPLIRRTFATFPLGERRMIGEKILRGKALAVTQVAADAGFDPDRAAQVFPVLAALLGVASAEGDAR